MLKLILNPLAFNYLILVLYALNSTQFLLRGYYPDACYWASAWAITATVTFGYQR